MVRDYYADAESIAKLLDNEGKSEVASTLREVIAAGAAATEILMGLRHHCQKALDDGVGSDTTKARLRTFVTALAKVLDTPQ